jgi:hypothetical protein
MLVQDVGSFDETVTMDQYAGTCAQTEPGRWEQTDGTGVAVMQDGALVLLTMPDQPTSEAIGATRPATTLELSVAAEHLRVITRDELREYLVHPLVDRGG